MTIDTQAAGQVPARAVSLALDSRELAATYDRVGTRQFEHGKLLIEALRARPGSKVLDVGCGTGLLGAYVAERLGPDGLVVGVDPLPLRVELAARKNPRFQASVGRAEDLTQFKDASFDALYTNSVFHWVEQKAAALSEFFRVLKPGGRLALNTADAERWHQSAKLVREAAREEGLDESAAGGFGNNHRSSRHELTQLIEGAGFRELDIQAHTFVDDVENADALMEWSISSSFGNFLSDLEPAQHERVRARLATKLETYRKNGVIQLERYLLFATATKP